MSDVSEHLNGRKDKMESLFSNTFTDDEVLSELYEHFSTVQQVNGHNI